MIFVILMAFCRGRRVASGRVLVQFLWGVVALVAVLILLIPTVLLPIFKGEFREAGRGIPWLLMILALSGILPALIFHFVQNFPRGRADRKSGQTPNNTPNTPEVNQADFDELFPKTGGGTAQKKRGKIGRGCGPVP